MISALMGAAAALVILGVFFAGYFIARRLSNTSVKKEKKEATAERRPDPELTEEEKQELDRVRADNHAFSLMLRYNIRDVYGMNDEDNFGSRG